MKSRINLEALYPGALVLGLILTVVCWVLMRGGDADQQRQISGSYMFGYIFWLSLTLGSFGLTVLYHVLKAKWALPVLRLFEAGGGAVMFCVMGLLLLPVIIPVALGHSPLYDWADPATRKVESLMNFKNAYLSPPFFIVRYVFFFLAWILVARFFRQSTAKQEKTGDLRQQLFRNNASGIAFVFFVLTVTWSLTDWVMSIDYTWYSTMYGLWSVVSLGIGGLCFAVMIFCWNASREPYKSIITEDLTVDIGNMMFVLTMLWAYTSLSQYLIIWSGNLPDQTFYYMERSKMSWNIIGFLTVVGQFFLPFVMLLTPRNKKIPLNLAKVAAFMLLIHVFDIYQYVLPAVRTTGPLPTVYDALAFVGVGLVWLGVCAGVVRRSALLPTFDNRLIEEAQSAH